MKKRTRELAIAAVIAVMAASPALAEDDAEVEALLGAEAVSEENLSKANGREAISLNAADLSAVHGHNEANNAVTGNANIGPGALTDFSGTAAVVMNTGNNSVVQVSQQIIFNLY